MSTKVITSLCLVAFVTGCASPQPAHRDESAISTASQHTDETRDAKSKFLLSQAETYSDRKTTELKPQLNLTLAQETAIRKVFAEKFTEESDQFFAVFLKVLLNGRSLPPEIPEPHLQPDRETLKPLLSEQQLAAYDQFKANQRKELAAKIAVERIDEIDSPLRLNEEQKNQIRRIFAASSERELKAVDDLDFSALSDGASEKKALAGILTAAQFERYERQRTGDSNIDSDVAYSCLRLRDIYKAFDSPPPQQQQSRHWWEYFAGIPVGAMRR